MNPFKTLPVHQYIQGGWKMRKLSLDFLDACGGCNDALERYITAFEAKVFESDPETLTPFEREIQLVYQAVENAYSIRRRLTEMVASFNAHPRDLVALHLNAKGRLCLVKMPEQFSSLSSLTLEFDVAGEVIARGAEIVSAIGWHSAEVPAAHRPFTREEVVLGFDNEGAKLMRRPPRLN
jgi:hypothetical protein